jgi:hypothetical protein
MSSRLDNSVLDINRTGKRDYLCTMQELSVADSFDKLEA